MEKTTVYLTADQKAALAEAARAEGRSEARLIRDGIETIVARHRVGEAAVPLPGVGAEASGPANAAADGAPTAGATVRPRWIARDEFVRRFVARQADPSLRAELRSLAPDTTDDVLER